MAAILGMAAIGAWALFTGQISYTITHGISMNPVYYQGDLVFVVKSSEYQVGDIAEYRDATTGIDVLHRIIGGDPIGGFVFKGDNNQSTDKFHPRADQVLGRAFLHVSHGGVWLKPLLSPTGIGMLGFLIVGGAAAAPRSRREIPRGRRKKKVKAMSRQGGSWETAVTVAKNVVRLPPLLRIAAALVTILAAAGLTLAVLGWLHPVTTVEKATAGPDQSMTFAYTAEVPQSAAYDGTKVTSPDPIFRKVADKVDLHIGYHGRRGTFEVTAALTNGTGWHTSMLLAATQAFTGISHDATVTLDLDAIDKHAAAAAKAIGVQPGPVTIDVTARVVTVDQATFTAPLPLALTPLQLALKSGPDSLSVKEAGAGPAEIRAMREIKVFDRSIMTAAQARSYAVLLLLAALVAATGIAFADRRNSQLYSRAEIERRYPRLLVPVEPMVSPPGKPVVLVDSLPALFRLAKRYDQTILTWSRPDGDDFIVRDEGITYLYRLPRATTSFGPRNDRWTITSPSLDALDRSPQPVERPDRRA